MSMFKRERLAQVAARTAEEGPRHRVLIVDDEENNLRVLRSVLGSAYELSEARDGQEALELLRSLPPEQTPRLILSDQRMPRMTGVELFTAMREAFPSTIRIIITGFVDVGAIVDAINRAGIYKFVVKPFDQAQLRLTVERAIEDSLEHERIASQVQALESRAGDNARRLERSLSALRRAHAEIARVGLVDELTGLGNRRLLISALDGREANARQPGADPQEHPRSAFLMLHLDDFAALNDRLGEAAGNALLRGVAGLLRAHCPEEAILVRLEGATFLLHVAAADDDEALRRASVLRDALAAAEFAQNDGPALRCSACIGVAAHPFVGNDPAHAGWELALAAAGAALRLARRDGPGSVLGLAPGAALPDGLAKALGSDPQALLEAGSVRVLRPS